MKTLNAKLIGFVFALAFLATTSFAALPLTDSEKASFSIPDTATIVPHAINQQLTASTIIPLDVNSVVSLSVDADILLNTKDSFVRILAKDDQGKEYLVFDSVILTPQDTFNLTNYAEETIDLTLVNIKTVSIEIKDASVTLIAINTEDSITSQRVIDPAASPTRRDSQIQIKTAKINARNAVEGLNFTTGPTNRISKLTYEQKKQIFHKPDGTAFDSLPNLNGLDYYIGGSFNDTGVIVDCDKVDGILGTTLKDDGTVGPEYFHPFVKTGVAIIPAPADAVLISGVSVYDWKLSSANTAALMTMAYWSSQGYPNVLPDNTNTVIPAPTDLPYGYVLASQIAPAIQSYAQAHTYKAATASYVSPLTWDAFKGEIDANRPMILLVDTNGDGIPDSVVTAVGYDNTISQYACYTTFDSAANPAITEKWFNFTPAAKGAQWGVSGGVRFDAAPAVVVTAATTSATNTTASSTTSGTTTTAASSTTNSMTGAITMSASLSPTPPKPLTVEIAQCGDHFIDLYFSPYSPQKQYIVFRTNGTTGCLGTTEAWKEVGAVTVNDSGGTTTNYYVCNGLDQNTQYSFKIAEVNSDGSLSYSKAVSATTTYSPPKPPEGLGRKFVYKTNCNGVVTGVTVNLAWVPGGTDYNHGPAQWYVVKRVLPSPWWDGTTTNNCYFPDGDVVRGATYTYYVVAVNNGGESAAANITVTVPTQ